MADKARAALAIKRAKMKEGNTSHTLVLLKSQLEQANNRISELE